MTEEVDPRLVALGLVPSAPTDAPAATPTWETATPPAPRTDAWVTPTQPEALPGGDPWGGTASAPPDAWSTPAPAVESAPASDAWMPGPGAWKNVPAAPEAPPPAASAPPAPPPATPKVGISGPKPLTVGDLFPGMGKFTGTPAPTPSSAPPSAPASAPPTFVAPPPPPPQPVAPARPAYSAPPVPETPVREAPPPLPPLASAMPTVVAQAPPAPPAQKKKEKAKKEARPARAAKPALAAPKAEKPKPPPKPRYQLPPSGVLLRGPIVMGWPEQKLQITLEQLGMRINAKEPIEIPWTDVRDIKARRGRVIIRTKGRPISFGIPIEGVSEPTLGGPLARVVKEASGGSLDLAGSAFLELQNATDILQDRYHDEDDPLIPTVVGLVFVLSGLTIIALLPDMLAILTRTPIGQGGFLLDSPLSIFDPRIFIASFAGAAMLSAGVVRVAMGKAATAWARGTLRGWHAGSRRPIELARRGLAAIVLSPAVAAALLLLSLVLALPSTRVQTVIDAAGFHIMREIPIFDDDRQWSTVRDIRFIDAPTIRHFEGVAVVFDFDGKSSISTLDVMLRGGTDKQLFEAAQKWWRERR